MTASHDAINAKAFAGIATPPTGAGGDAGEFAAHLIASAMNSKTIA